jgi:hypothetical protein
MNPEALKKLELAHQYLRKAADMCAGLEGAPEATQAIVAAIQGHPWFNGENVPSCARQWVKDAIYNAFARYTPEANCGAQLLEVQKQLKACYFPSGMLNVLSAVSSGEKYHEEVRNLAKKLYDKYLAKIGP